MPVCRALAGDTGEGTKVAASGGTAEMESILAQLYDRVDKNGLIVLIVVI